MGGGGVDGGTTTQSMMVSDVSIRSLPYLDAKWLRADLHAALQSTEDLAILWNNLIKDNELVSSSSSATTMHHVTVNSAGHLSYVAANGRHYCGQAKLLCSCCTGYCRPMSDCNCPPCHQLDMEEPLPGSSKKSMAAAVAAAAAANVPSDSILDSWLWGPIPSKLNSCSLHL